MSILVVGSIALDVIETPFARRENVLGGAASYFATAASLYDQVQMVAVIGEDFPQRHLDFWREHNVDLTGLQVHSGQTFRWVGRYHLDMNHRDTLDTQLGVFADFHPQIPPSYQSTPLIFLANIQPELQLEVLAQLPNAQFTVLDTMELWITTARDQLTEVIKRVDALVISEEEVRQYTSQSSIPAGVRQLLALGPRYVIVKQGSYGALLFDRDGAYFSAPAYPLEEVIDPTGAGDSFAGGLMGHLSTVIAHKGSFNLEDLKRAIVHGNIIGSFACADFGAERLQSVTLEEIQARYDDLILSSHFEHNWSEHVVVKSLQIG